MIGRGGAAVMLAALVLVASSASGAAPPRSQPVEAIAIAVGNVRSFPTMPAAAVRHDLAALFGLDASIVCGNEIGPARYRRWFRAAATAHGLTVLGRRTSNPIAITSTWSTSSVTVRRLSPARAHISGPITATIAVLEGPAGPLTVICTHLVARAWTHLERSTPLRKALWRLAAARIRRIVAAAEVPVLVLGDLNHPAPVRWAPGQVTLGNRGLIQAAAIPATGGVLRRGTGSRTIGLEHVFTDHPMIRRVLDLGP